MLSGDGFDLPRTDGARHSLDACACAQAYTRSLNVAPDSGHAKPQAPRDFGIDNTAGAKFEALPLAPS